MKTEVAVALIAGGVSLAAAGTTVWNVIRSNANAMAIEQFKAQIEASKIESQRQREMSRFNEQIARSAYDLQSRIFNVMAQGLISVHISNGNVRERNYVVDSTVFRFAEYLCWSELARRELQFTDLDANENTRKFFHAQSEISSTLGTDRDGRLFRIFSGEQRAIGEALIQTGARGAECMGYGAFLKAFSVGKDPLIDSLRTDVLSLESNLDQGADRFRKLQHELIKLLNILDPKYLRFPENRRYKV